MVLVGIGVSDGVADDEASSVGVGVTTGSTSGVSEADGSTSGDGRMATLGEGVAEDSVELDSGRGAVELAVVELSTAVVLSRTVEF